MTFGGPQHGMAPTSAARMMTIRASGIAAQVVGTKFESLPASARNWLSGGANTFMLDRCPRCRTAGLWLINSHALLAEEKAAFFRIWATARAVRL